MTRGSGRVTCGSGEHIGSGTLLPLVLSASLRLVSGLVVDAAVIAREHAQIV